MHIKIDEIWNLFLYLKSELPENMGVCVCACLVISDSLQPFGL